MQLGGSDGASRCLAFSIDSQDGANIDFPI
jgi:hypothetical protein